MLREWIERTVERLKGLFDRGERRRIVLERLDRVTKGRERVAVGPGDEDDRDVEAR